MIGEFFYYKPYRKPHLNAKMLRQQRSISCRQLRSELHFLTERSEKKNVLKTGRFLWFNITRPAYAGRYRHSGRLLGRQRHVVKFER